MSICLTDNGRMIVVKLGQYQEGDSRSFSVDTNR